MRGAHVLKIVVPQGCEIVQGMSFVQPSAMVTHALRLHNNNLATENATTGEHLDLGFVHVDMGIVESVVKRVCKLYITGKQ